NGRPADDESRARDERAELLAPVPPAPLARIVVDRQRVEPTRRTLPAVSSGLFRSRAAQEVNDMGVLDGVRVVEVAEHGFVPSAAAVLAEWGADVVKVERPSGDPLRAIQGMGLVADTGDFNFLFEQFNRNKRGVSIDLRTDDGRATLDRLLEWADVFITNFLPSARTKLRIQPEDVWAVNPRLVYARGHGQGQRGPDADQGGFDAVSYWSRGGIGHMLTPPDGPFIMQRGAMGDAPSGALLAGGV